MGPILNSYPDSMAGSLKEIVKLLQRPEFMNTFSGYYILPSLYHSDLDRGFSVQDYGLETSLATIEDLEALKKMGIQLKLDFILNHCSVLSPQFQDLIKNGENSRYKDFFINWNEFWKDAGEMNEEGVIIPDDKYLSLMFFRKPGLPLLQVEFPDGKKVPYWNTFSSEVKEENGKKTYLGQMDVNIQSPLVWQFYDETLKQLADYGASIVRLDAFAYAPKQVGKPNFLNEPETWDTLSKVSKFADKYNLQLLPEIHASYSEKKYEIIGNKGYLVYDFFLPGLLIHATMAHDPTYLYNWANEIIDKGLKTVNMLGCHDGIPVLDLKGLLPEEQIQKTMKYIVDNGGYVKNLDGKKNMYYQVNATYFSALGEEEQKLIFCRAIQMFMPGTPQVWYLDLFAGINDYEALERGHKEINRTNLSWEYMEDLLEEGIVLKQLQLLRLRNTHPIFKDYDDLQVIMEDHSLVFMYLKGEHSLTLIADFDDYSFSICEE